jgi:hypothetical protein
LFVSLAHLHPSKHFSTYTPEQRGLEEQGEANEGRGGGGGGGEKKVGK